MARPQTDLKVLESRGSIRKNPQRYRERLAQAAAAPPPIAMGDPPAHWNVLPENYKSMKFARWKAIWHEFAPQIPSGTAMKRALLEMFCESMDKLRNGSEMKASEKSYLMQLTVKLGIDQRGYGGGKKPQSEDGDWEAFG